ncbi:hypothetical protein N7470_003733 [Penicillium chermesinum]|nr:hypothetical protein N7470_003733 [Penicillium chermesinum]
MAQTHQPQQQQQPPSQFSQPFSPTVSSPSPHSSSPVNGGPAPPAAKRPRLSPLPQGQSHPPYDSPSFGAMQLPSTQPMNGTAPNSMPSTPVAAPPPAPPGTMGPPSRPADKTTDAAELTDVLASSGIDVREEEAFLTRSFSGSNAQAQPASRGQIPQQPPPISTSFMSQASTTGTLSASSSFGDLPIKPGVPHDSFSSDPTASPFKENGQPTREDTEAARRAQYHLQEPFLLTKMLEQRIQKRGFELGVRIPSEGLFHPVPGRPQPIEVTGPDGSSVIRTGQTIINQEGAPMVDILNLVSLSCEERLRGVIDYSSVLSRSRRAHSHGVVPTEWKDVAQSAVSGPGNGTNSLKRMLLLRIPMVSPMWLTYSTGSHNDSGGAFPKPVAERYRGLVSKEAQYENKRASKRTKRSADATFNEATGNRADSLDPAGSAPSTPIPEKAGLDKKSVSKKEARKMVDTKASEVQQHQQSVETARMATNSMLSGGRFGAKKTYSWLKSGGSSSGFSSPSRPNPSTPTAAPEKSTLSGETSSGPMKRRIGSWREDQEKGAGIQVRDLLYMLEADGRGIKHVQRGYSKDPKEDRGP